MSMLASLPMYDLPELEATTDAWWVGLRAHMAAAGVAGLPERLTRPADTFAHWRATDLLFSQTCGYPLTHALKGAVQLVATPVYAAPGCEGATYVSHIVVRADDPARCIADLRGRRAAFNGTDSQSGYNVLRGLAAPHAEAGKFFGAVVESGAHRRSLALVRAGAADVAAIDCVTFELIRRAAPQEISGLSILAASARAPALPYVTGLRTTAAELDALRRGLVAACGDPRLAALRADLQITGCEILPLTAYDAILDQERAALSAGYATLT